MLLKNTSHTWNDFAEPNPTSCQAMRNGNCFWLRGKMIGGTGGINDGIFLTGLPEDYDEWSQQGNKGWAWQDIHQYFTKATEDLSTVAKPQGSLVLNNFLRLNDFHILKDLLANGTAEKEYNQAIKSQGFEEDIMATVDRGIRMSTGKTYLGRVSKYRNNLHVLKNAVVRKIRINHQRKKVVGVDFQLNNSGIYTVRARKETILSAGTFNSPKILMLSGIGPCRHLKSLNISCVADLPVGRDFQDHGMMPLSLRFTRNVPTMLDSDSLQNTFDFLAFQKGPMAANRNLVGFINTLATENRNATDILITSTITRPTSESNIFKTLQFRDDLTAHLLQQVENQTVLELVGLVFKPKSRGFIQLKSADPLQGPAIYNRHGKVKEDRNKLLRFVRYVQNLLKTPSFQYYGLEFVKIPLEECDAAHPYDSNEYWFCYIKYFLVSAWHAVGTCRMGPNTNKAVVDSQLRVHGIKGLRVIDASIMPNITSGNTNGPTIMIAEKGSQMIKMDLSNAL